VLKNISVKSDVLWRGQPPHIHNKEGHGSIVTEILKNKILIPIDISKESVYYADFKYIGFVLPIEGYEPEKICLILKKGGKPLKSLIMLI